MIKAPTINELTENDKTRRVRLEHAIQILLHNTWFEYKKALEIFDEFDIAYLQACKYYENPAENSDIRPIFLLLIGDINTGKTTLVVKFMNYCELIAKQEDGKYSENDVVYIETPVHATFKRMFASLLERLSGNNQAKLVKDIHTDRLIDLVIKELRRRKVKILFIDEIQILVKASLDDKEDILNGFKKLANQSQTRLILVGTPQATELFKGTRWVDERFRALVLPKWKIDEEYIDLLFSIYQAYVEYLPDWDLVDKNGMVNAVIARHLHEMSDRGAYVTGLTCHLDPEGWVVIDSLPGDYPSTGTLKAGMRVGTLVTLLEFYEHPSWTLVGSYIDPDTGYLVLKILPTPIALKPVFVEIDPVTWLVSLHGSPNYVWYYSISHLNGFGS